jgi:hypothetical protein
MPVLKPSLFWGWPKRPTGRVAQRLRDEGYDDDIVRKVVLELADEGYLDDLAIARRQARQRRGARPNRVLPCASACCSLGSPMTPLMRRSMKP